MITQQEDTVGKIVSRMSYHNNQNQKTVVEIRMDGNDTLFICYFPLKNYRHDMEPENPPGISEENLRYVY